MRTVVRFASGPASKVIIVSGTLLWSAFGARLVITMRWLTLLRRPPTFLRVGPISEIVCQSGVAGCRQVKGPGESKVGEYQRRTPRRTSRRRIGVDLRAPMMTRRGPWKTLEGLEMMEGSIHLYHVTQTGSLASFHETLTSIGRRVEVVLILIPRRWPSYPLKVVVCGEGMRRSVVFEHEPAA